VRNNLLLANRLRTVGAKTKVLNYLALSGKAIDYRTVGACF